MEGGSGMKCRNCQQDSMHCVDDNGSIGGGVWEHYVCAICLTEYDYTKQRNVIKEKWTLKNDFIIRVKDELRTLYHIGISKED